MTNFHLAAWFMSLINNAVTDITTVNDDILAKLNAHYVLPRDMGVYLAYAGSANLQRVNLNSPTLRQINPPYIRPLNRTLLPADLPKVMDRLDQPFMLHANEEIQLQAIQGGAGAENFYAGVWIGNGLVPVPAGDIYSVQWTSTTAAVASTWTTVVPVFANALPPGTYALVGSTVISTTGVFHRYIFPADTLRPGGLSLATLGLQPPLAINERRLGVWGTFTNIYLPQPQVLCNAADAAHEGYMDLVKVG